MTNGPVRAEFWRAFVATRCSYPAPDRLRAQLAEAEFSEFCDCGCNSFAVKVLAGTPPLGPPGNGYGSIHTADFNLPNGQTLEIILFADDDGNLAFVEVDCCANSYPVPNVIETVGGPFNISSSEKLFS